MSSWFTLKDQLGCFLCENPCEKNSPKSAKTGKNRKRRGNRNQIISDT
jgi:hypothetical protein